MQAQNYWYVILNAREVKANQPIRVTRFEEQLVLWRDRAGKIVCMPDRCPHRGAALSLGRISNNCIECPYHGFEFDSKGQCQAIPANGTLPIPASYKIETYAIAEAYDWIWVWWGPKLDVYPPVPFFEDLDDRFTYSTYAEQWPIHFSRIIENELDFSHLPFVHRRTIGSGFPKAIEVETKVEGECIRAKVAQNDKKTDWETGYLEFRFPNIWRLKLAQKICFAAAFAPIDEKNTQIYWRFYQSQVQYPWLRHLWSWFMMKFGGQPVAREDIPVVTSQQPSRSSLALDEKLIASDRPIALYRQLCKMRDGVWEE